MEYKYKSANREEKANRTGIPDNMKKRFEAFSGKSFDDVRVHYRSQEPARLNALAYTQGTQVYIAPGQDRYLAHELGHVVQQKRGSVPVTAQINGMPVNDDRKMENQADEISQRVQNCGFHAVETSFDVNA